MKTYFRSILFMASVGLALSASAQDDVQQLKLKIDDLDAKVRQLEARPAASAPGMLRLIDTSVDLLVAAGTSSEDDPVIEELEGGGHDPKRRGFTLQQAELSLAGVVDPYFSGEAHIIFLEDEVELEEVFATSQVLPANLQLEAGLFLTEFGRVNPQHPHTWRWVDQPVINSRLLGGDGTRGVGFRLGWLTPTPWYSQLHVGMQDADNATMVSFLGEGHAHGEEESDDHAEEASDAEGGHEHIEGYEETIGGRPAVDRETDGLEDFLYLARWENSVDLTDETTTLLGVSGLFGPNATGDDGETMIYGADFTVKWRPASNQRGWPFMTWETEIMQRDFEADDFQAVAEDGDVIALSSETIEDWGLYSQVVWGFTPGWETGIRVDYATGNDAGLEERDADSARCDRTRISPLIAFRPSEFSRVRLQYNYDQADFLEDGEAHSVWAGLEILYGAHPAHKY